MPPPLRPSRAPPAAQAAVLVIASHRKSGISEFLLGSVAAHCAEHSSRPVLVLHAPAAGGGEPAGAGLLGRLASTAASALGGHPEEAEQQRAAAAAAAAAAQQAAGGGRQVILAVDDSGEAGQEQGRGLPGAVGCALPGTC